MSIPTEITRLSTAKANIKAEIESKGVIVPSEMRISDYAQLINDYLINGAVVVAKYNVTDTSSPTPLCHNNAVSQFSAIEIDGVVQTAVTSAYTFSTTGEHTVKYTLTDPTSIGESAFYGCSRLTSIVIPNSVTSIGNYAFAICNSLTSMTVDNNNTVYDSRNNCNAIIKTSTNTLIYGCKNTVIPNSVTSIGSNAFEDCVGLTSIVIPNSVTSIGDSAFASCTSLTSCTIGSGVTSIDERAFAYCSGFTSIEIPSGVTSIGARVFASCSGLASIVSNAMTAPTIHSQTFAGVKTGGTLYVPQGSSGYNTWMQKGNYYLGRYNWTKVTQ